MLMHVAGTFPDNYIYGKCTYYIWEYGEIGENNTYLHTDHVPQVYIPCRIPCSSLVQYSLNCSLITRYSTTLNFKNQLLAIKGTLASLHCCCPSFVAIWTSSSRSCAILQSFFRDIPACSSSLWMVEKWTEMKRLCSISSCSSSRNQFGWWWMSWSR